MQTETYNPSNPEPYSWPESMDQAGRDAAHRQICDWLRANGVDPAYVPADPRASLVDGQLTLLCKVRGPSGGDLVTPDRTGVMTETITVPVVVPPPPIVQTWLAPKCPSCER